MSEQILQIARRVKELREICGVTVEQIAKELDIDVNTYIRYEENGADIPISVLYTLANMLGVDMTELLTGRTPKLDTYCVAKKGEGVKVDRYPGYTFQSLAYKFIHKKMEPLMVEVEPSVGKPKMVSHTGQEFNLVMEGAIKVYIDEKEIMLEEGDCIYFNPHHPHGQQAMNGKVAKFLTIISE